MEDLRELTGVIRERRENPVEGSYTAYLFEKGLDKILKKVGEECAETIIAAKNGSAEEIKNECADLLYHLLVMLEETGTGIEAVLSELRARSEKQKNLKVMKIVDKNT